MEELLEMINTKATQYWNETDDSEPIEKFPSSIIDIVVESYINYINFPKSFDEEQIVSELSGYKNKIASECVTVYSKAGAEGELTHTENGITRQYDSSWLSKGAYDGVATYATVI